MKGRLGDFIMLGVGGLLGGMLVWGVSDDGDEPTPPQTPVTRVTVVTVPVAPHVVYVPVPVGACPVEDSCRPDYQDGPNGGRWVIIPGGDR